MISPTEQTARAAEAPKTYLLKKTISTAIAIKVATELNIYDQLIVHPEAHRDIFIAAARNLGKGRIFLIEKETSEEKVKGVAAAL